MTDITLTQHLTDFSNTMMEGHWRAMADMAWQCRENAHILGNTKVGAAAVSSSGRVFVGCNIEHMYRCHDVHAEVNAITSMVASGHKKLIAVLVTAEREFFTPCGSCMDWIFQFGGGDCMVAYQSSRNGEIRIFKAQELMPYYPR